ncbi:MAG: hypothetical protein EOM93_06950 [Gammaproteobacteria bacterium]|nr:hypothetical protein [Gammaproteobacteria bacterium]
MRLFGEEVRTSTSEIGINYNVKVERRIHECSVEDWRGLIQTIMNAGVADYQLVISFFHDGINESCIHIHKLTKKTRV